MKFRIRFVAFLTVILLVVSVSGFPVIGAEIYTWRDKEGVLHFSDIPPSKGDPGTASVDDAAPEKGLLWKIGQEGTEVSYLLGTIHSEDKRVLDLIPPFQPFLKNADSFTMEVILDEMAVLKVGTAMIYLDSRTLEATIGGSLYYRVVPVMEIYGIPEVAVNKMKPWAVLTLLSVPKPETGYFMDRILYQSALKLGKKVYGLESVDEQLEIFEGIPLEDQISLLKAHLDRLPMLPSLFDEMIETYISGDLQKITELSDAYMGNQEKKIVDRFMKRLNQNRNKKMVRRMLPRLEEGNAFIAVGALHLPGASGILQQLRQKGYNVSVAK